ncbi:MAG TPA: hypothetical protein VGN16_09495 [Acidobacteriaceae bacterium]|jgi:hypothetical protein
MTIVTPAKERISGILLEGHRISCHNDSCNHCTNFFPDTKHLPTDVVANKFRERGWEVNSNGKDFCPNCRIKKREKKAPKVGQAGAAEASIRALREVQYANAKNARQLISGVGLIATDIIQLEHKHTRFKITFRGMRSVPIGRIASAEGELVEVMNGALVESSLKFEMTQREDNGSFIFDPVVHWYITLDIQKKNADVVTLRPRVVAAE